MRLLAQEIHWFEYRYAGYPSDGIPLSLRAIYVHGERKFDKDF